MLLCNIILYPSKLFCYRHGFEKATRNYCLKDCHNLCLFWKAIKFSWIIMLTFIPPILNSLIPFLIHSVTIYTTFNHCIYRTWLLFMQHLYIIYILLNIQHFVVIYFIIYDYRRSRDSSVGIATSYGLDDRGVGVRILGGQEFSLLHVVRTGSGDRPTSYPIGTGGSFSGSKAAGAWSWPFTSS
jgi:hypothetical protein